MSKKRGLPDDKHMRHSEHFIDSLLTREHNTIGKMLSIEALEINPHQPRKNLGDLDGLISSIRSHGILEPLLVSPVEGGKYIFVAGERRYHAALACGFTELPCIETSSHSDAQNLEIALIENLQRKDLDAFEEATAYKVLQDKFLYTQEMISEKIGKKRSTVAEILAVADIPDEIRDLCRHADISAKSLLLEISKAGTLQLMRQMIDAIMSGKSRETIRQMRKQLSSSSPRSISIKADGLPFKIRMDFQSHNYDKSDLINFLKNIIDRIENNDIKLVKSAKKQHK